MLDFGRFGSRIVARRELPGRPARYAPLPDGLHPQLSAALRRRGIDKLYRHQAEMFARASVGEHLVITTGTASGKSLAFLLPVLQGLAADPSARALLLYPTKALSHDQLRGLVALLAEVAAADPAASLAPLEAGVYDGDTSPLERQRVRERAQLVLTNPDMLHAALLPAHGRPGYAHLFRHVRYLVIDEAHIYRGAFGAHVSNVMRRLLRICAHYGSQPQILCSSATIANPVELCERLCHRPFGLVDDDGSPSAGRVVHFWLPPKIQGTDVRRGVVTEMAAFLPHLLRRRHKTIAFCRSRKETEVVLKEARDRLARTDGGHDESTLLAAYRGGYTPKERRRVEEDLISGRLLGVVSTNALELGIDVGALEVVVQAGFPGTRASFWQQVGRAGRRGRQAHAVVMLAQRPEDQYIAADPDWLVGRPAEHAVVDPDNLTVQLAHVRAAAAELPLRLDDVATWPDLAEILPLLQSTGQVRPVAGAFHWTGGPFPAGEFSLRNTDGDRFKVIDRTTGRVLTEMTRPQVYREAHTRAIYLHDGQPYLVEALDLVGHTAQVVAAPQNYYTQPDVRTRIEVLVPQGDRALGRTRAHFGDVRVTDTVVGYKMLEFHNHQNLGYEALHEPLSVQRDTEAVWWPVPPEVLVALARDPADPLRGMVSAVRAMARLHTMAEGGDLAGSTFSFSAAEAPGESDGERPPALGADTRTAVICYDGHPGGMGFAAKAFDLAEPVLRGAVQLLGDCPCQRGCPACTGDETLEKHVAAWGLRSLFESLPLPESLRPVAAAAPGAPTNSDAWGPAPFCALSELPARWPEVRAAMKVSGLPGAGFFERVDGAQPRGGALALTVRSAELARWASETASREALEHLVRRFVAVPAGFRLEVSCPDDAADASQRRALGLRRRLEDLSRGEPGSERAANERLGSGYVLPTHQRAREGTTPAVRFDRDAAAPGAADPDAPPDPERRPE